MFTHHPSGVFRGLNFGIFMTVKLAFTGIIARTFFNHRKQWITILPMKTRFAYEGKIEWCSRGRGFKSRRPDVSFMSQTDFKYDCCFYGQSVSGPELLTLAVFLGEPDKYAESQSVFCHRGRFRHRVSKSVPLLTGIAE